MKPNTNKQLAAIIFTDIEGFSKISSNDQEIGLRMAQMHRQVIQHCAPEFGGRCINFYGDGSLSLFGSAQDAIHCAILMQQKFNSENSIPVRIGIHLGEVYQDDNSAYGDAINIAARIQNISPPGGILVSHAVKTAIGSQESIQLKPLGKEYLKNIKRPISLFSVDHPSAAKVEKFQVHQNANSQNSLRRHHLSVPTIVLFLLLLVISGLSSYMMKGARSQMISEEVFSAQLAVMPFDNLTGIEGDSFICKIAASTIISGLQEIEGTKVISYAFLAAYKPKDLAGVYQPVKVPKISKAINLIHGEIRKENDTIVIKAFLMNLETGKYLHVFPEARSSYNQPIIAITELESHIKGYWLSKELVPLTVPNYDASKYYTLALEAWDDDSLALYYLNKSIDADSTFLDAYLMKLDVYYNLGKEKLRNDLHQVIKERFPMEKLNKRQQNIIRYDQADMEGKNVLTYQYFLKEFNYYPEELFNNTNMAVLALEYVNNPNATLSVLNYIDAEKIDYHSNPYWVYRLDLELRALIDLGLSSEAIKLIDLYPKPIESTSSNQLAIRAYLTAKDTNRIRERMRDLEYLMRPSDFAYLNLMVAKDAYVLNLPEISTIYAQQALSYRKSNQISKNNAIKAHFLLGEYEQALLLAEELWKNNEHVYYQIQVAVFKALLGSNEEAVQMLKAIEIKSEELPYGYIPYYVSHIYTALGNNVQALIKLEQSLNAGKKFNKNRYQWDAYLKPLHDLPSFQQKIHPALP